MGDGLVQARGLRKIFGSVEAVRGIDVDVARGEVFGFLGPNGAGKSTTMRMIACVSPRSAGSLSVLGLDPGPDGPQIRARIGVVPQLDNLDAELSVRQNLEVYGRYFGLPRARVRAKATELLEFVQLAERADEPVEPLSGGMKRRLTIARAAGQRPGAAAARRAHHRSRPAGPAPALGAALPAQARGRHEDHHTNYMDEASSCATAGVMDGGLIVAEGSPGELIDRYSTKEVLELRFAPELRPAADAVAPFGERVEELPDRLLLYTVDGERAQVELAGAGFRPMSALIRRSSLEDVFLRLTGRTLVD